jgi:hypothetical protein
MSAPFYFQEFVDARILDMCIPVKLASVVNHHPLDICVDPVPVDMPITVL